MENAPRHSPNQREDIQDEAAWRSLRDERDFGLETETETRVVSVSVSSFETKRIKSQSQNLRLISKVSVSVSNFETRIQKSRSQSQNAKNGLAHH